ncbi:MAG: hypothetical protein EA376_10880 [Phycisphaeraceae bacterium]|nr:MAG: hypothetical protein EA376_10880 [Phycisphaeraceae bacterium]
MNDRDTSTTTAHQTRPTPANRLGLDYRAEASRLGPAPAPIIDVHTHINGVAAARIYREARDLYGVTTTYSMTQLREAEAVRDALDGTVHFIAVPDYLSDDRARAMREGFLENIQAFHDLGSRIVKFWAAPRSRDMAREIGDPDEGRLDGAWRLRAMELGESLGMMFMAHIGDPDTWFQTRYAEASLYGTKSEQYLPFERMLDRFSVPWIGAHMGGWPEDLDFLDGLLSRHDNLHLDTSATKWMVRELSKHPRDRFCEFFEKWRDRILFGSDIVTLDAHLSPDDGPRGMGMQAASEAEAFDLYASRYWALRTLFETDYDGESPIADPDLNMIDPDRHDAMAAPPLRGKSLPAELLRDIYRDNAVTLLDGWREAHP